MPKKKPKIDEEALRERIRRELEEKHQQTQKSAPPSTGQEAKGGEEVNRMVVERFLREKVEEELYSGHPEFIRCENHLGEVRWFTLFELENEYEFYPVEESALKKFFSRFKPSKAPKVINREQAKETEERFREEVSLDIERRLQEFNRQREEVEHNQHKELESKIYQEELDRFYRSQPGYKKYKNHLGEVRWMTQEEFEAQDEFLEEVLSPRQKAVRIALLALPLLLVGGLLWFLYLSQLAEEIPKGHIIVDVNKEQGHLYLDQNLVVGFEPNKLYPIEAGRHVITVISPEYRTIPTADTVDIEEGDTVRISFQLVPRQLDETGLVLIGTNTDNANIFVDGEFYGDLKTHGRLNLTPGPHTVIVRKEGHVSEPPQHTVNIVKGDTTRLFFKLKQAKATRRLSGFNPLTDVGFIEVKTNVKGARIILDGQPTNFKSDYVLQRIPYGKHIIQVEKDGYKAYPEERVVHLDKSNKKVQADFTLTALFRVISLRTVPVDGMIYLDGKQVAKGRFKGSLPLGKHTVDFSEVPFYKKPHKQTIDVRTDGPGEFVFRYSNLFSVYFTPKGVQPSSDFGHVVSGYVLEESGFQASNQTGPDVTGNATIGEEIWNLGLAFGYRNPPGSDALLFIFSIPENVDLSESIWLKIWAYNTKDYYPLVVKGESAYRIQVNNYKFRNEVRPKYELDQIAPDHYEQFDISNVLQHGRNVILIATTEDATAHLALWKVAIE